MPLVPFVPLVPLVPFAPAAPVDPVSPDGPVMAAMYSVIVLPLFPGSACHTSKADLPSAECSSSKGLRGTFLSKYTEV